ncbi:tetratricopeptide repeat protein [Aeoliella sp.]|uniref:tetratricopeptide repeat protein n=1 Tax=Aeoliella sp. TaxID=2795800 RepID=UPI003CCC3CE2
MRGIYLLLAVSWVGLWFTPDQQAQRLVDRKEYAEAAETFDDPLRQGAAWYRAGEFEKAVQAFARVDTPEARFNEGNAWVMLGKYEQAVDRYDEALNARPGWKDAKENREIAELRAKRLDTHGGDIGDQQEGADEVVFDPNKPKGGQDTEIAGEQAASDSTIQAMWLRNVQTKPSDFLKAKFAYQDALDAGSGEP